ncbi:MAG: hypothetical protein PWQ67_536 [Clostridia bacterium]|jgi:hypothetical protein|nr:hypothetical protein [Clostridia bacterium]MDN5322082.1 hypothetical protein [Clostridia bacterium]
MSSILAYFETTETAEKVKKILENKGIETIQMDRISEVPAQNTGEFNNPINRAYSLAALTNTSGNFLGGDVGPLLSASPASSGYGGDRVGSRNILMTIVTSEDKIEECVKIIKQNKGFV